MPLLITADTLEDRDASDRALLTYLFAFRDCVESRAPPATVAAASSSSPSNASSWLAPVASVCASPPLSTLPLVCFLRACRLHLFLSVPFLSVFNELVTILLLSKIAPPAPAPSKDAEKVRSLFFVVF